MIDYHALFERCRRYDEFLGHFGQPTDVERWQRSYSQVQLTSEQRDVLAHFRRRQVVLCMAGVWCGDCVRQCPILQQFASVSPAIELRFFDRDAESLVASELTICGSPRVPQVIFLSEDLEFISRYGDRTLTQYRQLAARLAGVACASGLVVPQDPLHAATVAEWLAEFERAQLILRTSPKLRERYGD